MIFEDVIDSLADVQGRRFYDAIGIQSHMHGGVWSTDRILDIVHRFARYGVPLHFTETTIVSGPGRWDNWEATTPEGERLQADEVVRFYQTVFSCPEVAALTWWDLSDRRAWQNAPAGLVRRDMSPKPAYTRLLSLIKGRWWSNDVNTTDAGGTARFRLYGGRHLIKVILENGQTEESTIELPYLDSVPSVIIEVE